MSDPDRPARPEDVDEVCASLPDTELGTSWGDRPTWKVPRGDKGKGFVLYRAPHKTAVDPTTGEMYDDLVVIVTPTEADKHALVEIAAWSGTRIDRSWCTPSRSTSRTSACRRGLVRQASITVS